MRIPKRKPDYRTLEQKKQDELQGLINICEKAKNVPDLIDLDSHYISSRFERAETSTGEDKEIAQYVVDNNILPYFIEAIARVKARYEKNGWSFNFEARKMGKYLPKESLSEVTQEEADEMDAEELDRLFETREVEATAYKCIMYKDRVLADGSPVYKVWAGDENGDRETCLFNSLDEAKEYAKTFFHAHIFGGRHIRNDSADMESPLSESWETNLVFYKGELSQDSSKYFFMNLEYFKDN